MGFCEVDRHVRVGARFSKVLLVSGAVALAGCELPGGRTDPVIASRIDNRVSALATGAERRLVLTSQTRLKEGGAKGGNLLVCAEPSPDAVEALSSSVEASIAAQRGGDQSANIDAANRLATSVALAMRRTQGLQLFRDGVFALCQGAMNGLRDAKDPEVIYQKAFGDLVQTSAKLIELELKGEAWKTMPQVVVQTPALPAGQLTRQPTQPPTQPPGGAGGPSVPNTTPAPETGEPTSLVPEAN